MMSLQPFAPLYISLPLTLSLMYIGLYPMLSMNRVLIQPLQRQAAPAVPIAQSVGAPDVSPPTPDSVPVPRLVQTGTVHLSIGGWIDVSFCLPQKIHKLHLDEGTVEVSPTENPQTPPGRGNSGCECRRKSTNSTWMREQWR